MLRSVELHKDKFRTDELQLLHTLHNLAEVLSLKPAGVAPTLRDDQLGNQVNILSHATSEGLHILDFVKLDDKVSIVVGLTVNS